VSEKRPQASFSNGLAENRNGPHFPLSSSDPSCLSHSAMSPEQVAELIRAGLPGADVRVESEDHTHFAARIVAREFEGKRSIARHQLVYRTLGELMGREIHALSIEALTPEEWAAR
jgi:acid stress-induced BolA-like protein IbaG/YrbA